MRLFVVNPQKEAYESFAATLGRFTAKRLDKFEPLSFSEGVVRDHLAFMVRRRD